MSCTAQISRIRCAARSATFRQRCRYGGARCTRGEDYERVVVDPHNVCDDCRIAVSGVAARRHRERDRENDLGQLAARIITRTTRNCPRYTMRYLRRMCWLFWVGLPMLAAYPVPSPLATGTSFSEFLRPVRVSRCRKCRLPRCFLNSITYVYTHTLFDRQENVNVAFLPFLSLKIREINHE